LFVTIVSVKRKLDGGEKTVKTWTFEIEVVTPIFLSGATQEVAELRPNTIKNLMRWWYRAVRGEGYGEIQNFKEFEIFGSTENAGKFIPRISFRHSQEITPSLFEPEEFRNFEAGIKYFAFPFRQSKRSKIDPLYTFQLSLKFLSNVSVNDENAIIASFWLLIFLGGVGSRSRRGFGSLRVKKPFFHESSGLQFFFDGEAGIFPEFFQKNLSLALKAIGYSRSPKDSKDVSFTTLSAKDSRIYLYLKDKQETFNWGREALHQIGKLLQEFRNHTHPRNYDDYLSIKNFLDSNKQPIQYKRAVFGLPIVIQYRSLFEKYFVELATEAFNEIGKIISKEALVNLANGSQRIAIGELQLKGLDESTAENIWKNAKNKSSATLEHGIASKDKSDKSDRRSSPLFIKVIKLKKNEYALVLLFLPSKLLPDEEQLKVTSNDGREDFVREMADFSMINDFLDSVEVKRDLIEISF